MIGLYTLPVSAATQSRTLAVGKQLEHYFATSEQKNMQALFTVAWLQLRPATARTLGQAFFRDPERLEGPPPASARTAPRRSPSAATAGAVRSRCTTDEVFILVPPAVPQGWVQQSCPGFDLRAGGPRRARPRQAGGGQGASCWGWRPRTRCALGRAAQQPARHPAAAPSTSISPGPRAEAGPARRRDHLRHRLGPSLFINNFVDRGRVKRVFVQGDAPYRARPEDVGELKYVRGSHLAGRCAAVLHCFAKTDWTAGPAHLRRFNGSSLPSLEIPGASPGRARAPAHGDAARWRS